MLMRVVPWREFDRLTRRFPVHERAKPRRIEITSGKDTRKEISA